MRKIVFVSFCLFLLTVSLIYGAQDSAVKPKNIILFGWDGAQRNHVKECMQKSELPNLQQLVSEGTIVAIDILRITDTKAGWTQILTGYNPEITGVFNNSDYQPIPKGLSVFERLETFFGTDNIVTVGIIAKKHHVGAGAPEKKDVTGKIDKDAKDKADELLGKIVKEGDKRFMIIPGEPYYITQTGMDVFTNGLEKNETVGTKAIELLEKYKDKPFFFFIHFAEIDHVGHKKGENSKETNDAYISCDT